MPGLITDLELHLKIVVAVTFVVLTVWFLAGPWINAQKMLSAKRIDENHIIISDKVKRQFISNNEKGYDKKNVELFKKILGEAGAIHDGYSYDLNINTWTIHKKKMVCN